MKLLIALTIFITGCTTLNKPDSYTIYLEANQSAPTCAWLKRNGILFIESADAYEITTDELCDGDL